MVDVKYPGFGRIVVDGIGFEGDVVVADGIVRLRDKAPSRLRGAARGHTPLTTNERLPWSRPTLVIGSGHSGRLPILPEVWEEASARGVELKVLPTNDACALLRTLDASEANAVLHVTC